MNHNLYRYIIIVILIFVYLLPTYSQKKIEDQTSPISLQKIGLETHNEIEEMSTKISRLGREHPKANKIWKEFIKKYEKLVEKNPDCHSCFFRSIIVYAGVIEGYDPTNDYRKLIESAPDVSYYQYMLASELTIGVVDPAKREMFEEGLSILKSLLEKDNMPSESSGIVSYYMLFDFLLKHRLPDIDNNLYEENLKFFNAQLKKGKKAEDFLDPDDWEQYKKLQKFYLN